MHVKTLCVASVLMWSGLMAPASAQTDPSTIRIANLTDFNTPSIQGKVVELAPAAFSKNLGGSKYALWTYTDAIAMTDGENYCVAFVGLVHPAQPGKTARMPRTRQVQITKADKTGKLTEDEWNTCKSDALVPAIRGFSAGSDWNTLAREADAVTSEQGTRKATAANFTQFVSTYIGRVQSVEVPDAFTQAFDRRTLQIAILSTSLVVDNKLVCYAAAGVTARAPDKRNPHLPAHSFTQMRTQPAGNATPDEKRDCETAVAQEAVDIMLAKPWDQSGLLKDIAATREEGLPLVTAPRKASVNSVQRNTVSCHNECTNGNCLRTFSDGRKERWQAPRVFNPLTNNWEWQVNSCGQ